MEFDHLDRAHVAEGSSDRIFGLVFAMFFVALGTWLLLSGGAMHPWLLGGGILLAVLALAAPGLLAPFNRLWTRFGLLLGRAVSPVVLGILFFLVVTPIGLLMRALGKEPLTLKRNPTAASYWVFRTPPGPAPGSFRDPF